MGNWVSRSMVFLLSGILIFTSACTGMRLRTPTSEEKRNFVFSKNIDRAIIDSNEQGPLSILPYLSGAQGVPDSPAALWNQQKELVNGDIILTGYDDDDEADAGMGSLSGEEKGTSVFIATLIVLGVLVGAALPILYAIGVF